MQISKILPAVFINIFFVAVFTFSSFVNTTRAQSLSKSEINQSVQRIAKLVEENYVFPKKGKEIATEFSKVAAQRNFDGAKDWQEFSRVVTAKLRAISGDGHLFVKYDPLQVKELNAPPQTEGKADAENLFFYGAKARAKNYGFQKVEILDGNIGYLKLSEINMSEKSLRVLIAAMRFVENTQALIVDLRDNGGGGGDIGSVLESFFLPKNTLLLEFRSRSGATETSKTVAWLTEKKYDAPLFIIVNKKTGSAAEAFAFALQAKKRAVIVGQTSAGAAHMNSWYPVNDFIYVSVSTGAPVLPRTEMSWEGRGVQPDFSANAGEEIQVIKNLIAKNKRFR